MLKITHNKSLIFCWITLMATHCDSVFRLIYLSEEIGDKSPPLLIIQMCGKVFS